MSAPKETARAPPTAPTHVDPAPRDASAPAAAGFDADGAEPRMGAAMRAASAVSFDADLRSIAPCSVSDVAQISPRDIFFT